jgi:UDP-N-acetylglucosamine 1-carboxyvinyltransferase
MSDAVGKHAETGQPREAFVIEGGHKLSGRVRISGNKNEALPAVAATLLTDEPVILENLPNIVDVRMMCQMLSALGTEVTPLGPGSFRFHTPSVRNTRLDPALARRVRASILFAGPLLGRFLSVDLPPPGGDVIGRRRLDTHVNGLVELGASFEADGAGLRLCAKRLVGADIFLDEASVTGTENLLMAATLAEGTTVLRNAACEPHVQNLARMLNAMGARIRGIGTNELHVEGVERLHGCTFRIGPDYLEVGSFIGLAAVTGSELVLEDACPEHLRMIRLVFERLGIHVEPQGKDLLVPADQTLRVRKDLFGATPRIDDAPWPQFPTDLMSIAIVTATQTHGTVLFFEKMFEGRMFFVDSLIGMGAEIILCDPHRVVVVGPTRLVGATLESPDVRAGMAIVIAALCARGRSTIHNIRQVDRGYERIDDKLAALGARITRIPA